MVVVSPVMVFAAAQSSFVARLCLSCRYVYSVDQTIEHAVDQPRTGTMGAHWSGKHEPVSLEVGALGLIEALPMYKDAQPGRVSTDSSHTHLPRSVADLASSLDLALSRN